MDKVLKIASDFTETPGPRFRIEGEFSGELFREEILNPLYLEARASKSKILVDLDGVEGYATSFLEEAFGGLRRLHPEDDIFEVLRFKADEEPLLLLEIKTCVSEALDGE